MKRSLLASVSIAALANAALAGESPLLNASVTTPPPLWTDFYAGLNSGYGWGTGRNPGAQSGFIGGGQFGFNYRLFDNIVVGAETDIQGASIGGTVRNATVAGFGQGFPGLGEAGFGQGFSSLGEAGAAQGFAGLGEALLGTPGLGEAVVGIPGLGEAGSIASLGEAGAVLMTAAGMGYRPVPQWARLDFLGTVRGRVGYLVTPTLLAYGTGGFAYGGGEAQFLMGLYNVRANYIGYTAGGGLEWIFSPKWSLKTEGLYYNLSGGRLSPNYQGVTARLGISYHFDLSNARFPGN